METLVHGMRLFLPGLGSVSVICGLVIMIVVQILVLHRLYKCDRKTFVSPCCVFLNVQSHI